GGGVGSGRRGRPQRRGRAGTAAAVVRPLDGGTVTRARRVSCILLLAAAGCAQPAAPPPRDLPRTVAVLAPHNETGARLPVAGSSLLQRYAFDPPPLPLPPRP